MTAVIAAPRIDSIGRVIGASPQDRFTTFVDFTDAGCWRWTGKHDRNGYGRFRLDGRWQLAHRVAYALFVEPIPASLEGDHLCEVKDCVNPDHVDLVTSGTNMRRQGRIGARAAQTHCKRGHEYTTENTLIDGRGCRSCRTCKRITGAARRAR